MRNGNPTSAVRFLPSEREPTWEYHFDLKARKYSDSF